MTNLNVKIEAWQKKLLDIGKRNRLINYRDTVRSNIRLISPSLESLYKDIVVHERTLKFSFASDDEYSDEYKIRKGDIETDRTLIEQQKTLKNLKYKAKASIEEQGVNTLFMAFGFLEWPDDVNSRELINSPLVLVPVNLTSESLSSPYKLNLHEDEIIVNPTLKYKIQNNFGISLPEFKSQGDDIVEYINSVRKEVAKKNWKVKFETVLSLFSFSKMNMYSDLELNRERISANPIIKALGGDTSEIENIPEEFLNFEYDVKDPIESFQVVDADSSQEDALLYAKNGISFVLQGPPGTGKSQTITNIIAEALADGKKVLFVSEKLAALDVVHKKLCEADLSEFCLLLHSDKTNKKDILNELEKTLYIGNVRLPNGAINNMQLLQKKRESLNKYVRELHSVCAPLNKSIYEISGKLSKLIDSPEMNFKFNNIDKVSYIELHNFITLITEYSSIVANMSIDYRSNPWRYMKNTNISYTEIQDIKDNLPNVINGLKNIEKDVFDIMEKYDIEEPMTYNYIKNMEQSFELISRSPKAPKKWLSKDDLSKLFKTAEECRSIKDVYNEKKSEMDIKFTSEIYKLNADDVVSSMSYDWSKIKNIMRSNSYAELDELISDRKELMSRLDKMQDIIDRVLKNNEILCEIGLRNDNTVEQYKIIKSIIEIILTDIEATELWFEGQKFEDYIKSIEDVENSYRIINEIRGLLLAEYTSDVLLIDYNELYNRFSLEYTNILKNFKKDYKNDKKLFLSLKLDKQKKIDNLEIIEALNKLKEIETHNNLISGLEANVKMFLGGYYNGADTDWQLVYSKLNSFRELKNTFTEDFIGQFPDEFKTSMISRYIDKEVYVDIYNNLDELVSSDLQNSIRNTFKGKIVVEKENINNILKKVRKLREYLDNLNELYDSLLSCEKETLNNSELKYYLNLLNEIQKIEEDVADNETKLKRMFLSEYNGLDTDWSTTIGKLNWTNEYIESRNKFVLSSEYMQKNNENDEFIQEGEIYSRKTDIYINDLERLWTWIKELFILESDLDEVEIKSVIAKLEGLKDNLFLLQEWLDYSSSRNKCEEVGLAFYIENLNLLEIKPELMTDSFLKRFYRLWLNKMLPNHKAVESFRRSSK
jgi:hypothetical protein